MVKNKPAKAGDIRDVSSIPGWGRFPGGGNGNPLQYSCVESPHGQRHLVGCRPWGSRESDLTEHEYKPHEEAYLWGGGGAHLLCMWWPSVKSALDPHRNGCPQWHRQRCRGSFQVLPESGF